jgi:excisionase family DNA binding protein
MNAAELRAHGDFVTTKVAAEYLGVSEPLIRRLVAKGELDALRLSNRVRIRTRDLLAMSGAL